MVETTPRIWPGQVEEGNFSLTQVRALSSVARSEVFWAFSPTEPRSANEIASLIRRTRPTVRYHVNELIKADMLVAVQTRRRRSRTEEAYVHRIVRGYTPGPPYDKDYLAEMHRGLAAIFRHTEREREACLITGNEEPAYGVNHSFRQAYLRLSPEKIEILKKELSDVIYKYWGNEDAEGTMVHVMGLICPTLAESQDRFRTLTGKEITGSDESDLSQRDLIRSASYSWPDPSITAEPSGD
jgi:hypothetical protein